MAAQGERAPSALPKNTEFEDDLHHLEILVCCMDLLDRDEFTIAIVDVLDQVGSFWRKWRDQVLEVNPKNPKHGDGWMKSRRKP